MMIEECRVSVVLPTYNESENIVGLIHAIDIALSGSLSPAVEYIVVDDDSPDGTGAVVQAAFQADTRVKVLRRVGQRRLASAIADGVRTARGHVVAWLDCDFSMPPGMLADLIKAVDQGKADIAVGSRFVKGGKDGRLFTEAFAAVLMSRMLNFFVSAWLNLPFRDFTSGFVAAKRDVFARVELRGDYGEYFIDFIHSAHRAGYRIVELPYHCGPRFKGVSKTGRGLISLVMKGWKYLALTLCLRKEGLKRVSRP